MARPAFDVDLDAWKNRSAFHPANTRLKQLGHELARKAVVALGELLHWLLPAGPEKSIAFQRLDEVRLYANMALAVNGGPAILYEDETYTEDAVTQALRQFADVQLVSDPRIKEYEAEQRGEAADRSGAELREARPTLPGADPDAPRQGMTGVAVQEASNAAIPGEKPTSPADQFLWESEPDDNGVAFAVDGHRGYVALVVRPQTGPATAVMLGTPKDVNDVLHALAAAGDRAFR
jgi:hypothetical protein